MLDVEDDANEIARLQKVIIGLKSEIEDLQNMAETLRTENTELKAS